MSEEITAETVRQLAQVARLRIPDEDVEPLVAALRSYREAFVPIEELEELGLTGVDPMVTMDPRWKA